MTAIALPRALRIALALAAAGPCAACGGLDSFIPHGSSDIPNNISEKFGGAAKENQAPSEKPVRLPLTAEELDCPPVEIDEGGASARIGGPENSSVRYQFDISQTARECAPLSDKQFTLKVGVSGRLLIGPAGQPGAYSVPLRVTVHDEYGKKDAFTKVYKIETSVDNGAEAPFTFVTEPIVLPMTRTELAEDYTLTVGFDSGKAAAPAPKPRKPRPQKTAAPN